jgi:hypothetical protein
MIGRFACPPCVSLFGIEQWLRQKNNVVTLNVTSIENHSDSSIAHRKFKQPKDRDDILYSLFKVLDSKNV